MANLNSAAPASLLSQQTPSNKAPLPLFTGSHYEIFCFENNLPTGANTPQLNIDPRFNYHLQYEDHDYDLTQSMGFSGYFNLARWQKNYGDGGVDVTGAPNVALVEGTNAALVNLIDQQSVILEIDIPAEGYVKFDWRKIGGSHFSLEVKAGDQCFYLEVRLNGHYFSPLLQAGDQLRLVFSTPQEAAIQPVISLENFQFYSNAVQVIARKWKAINKNDQLASFTQFISINPLDIEQIIFPAANHLTDSEAIFDPTSLIPEVMGVPYIDRDGNGQTIEDRYHLGASNCAFDITWEDELFLERNNWTILRRWQVSDLISQNIIEKTQIIKLYTDALEEYPQEYDMDRISRNIGTVFKTKSVIQYLEWQAPNE